MTFGTGCFLFGLLCVSEGGFRFFNPEKMHYFWEHFRYEQPLAPSRWRLWSIQAWAVLEILIGVASFWAAAVM